MSIIVDSCNRQVTYLRVSVTDRCNYRCTYCIPEEGVKLQGRDSLLTFEELEALVAVFARLGVRRVRLTGGEPTVRHGVERLVTVLTRVPGIDQVVMTTNGHQLTVLAEPLFRAGLAQLNVSLDTLEAQKFAELTRRGSLFEVLSGIDAALGVGICVKINAVALRGVNDDELGRLCAYAWERGIVPRFIEWMPMSAGGLYAPRSLIGAAEIRALIEKQLGFELRPLAAQGVSTSGPARYWHVDQGHRVGIISPMSEHFCDTCNRVRLSAIGELHTCLGYDDATDLRAIMRGGGTALDLETAIRGAILGKRPGHNLVDMRGPTKHMVSIGG